ncbi:hypothetical protein MBCUT_03530 [Methanobrevibacter cuticularis]|uniref:Uncharacterized protein n=1 Tax=Methanobrevibacter cuticularis TaxID=47311 RepID=A0A166EXN2_9EURY|nr:hypothetical protein [Methanobrevibacter cuticularis]KZX17121.1 hypothetical protein MBCUT_03530 [Methanobrevibacter cuticularis]
MNKKLVASFLSVLLIGSITTVMADPGVYKNGKVTVNENGINETYDAICVDENRVIYDNTK